ncbi:hypothetical protein THAOC_31694 [Thalassiosira oceanica]|uniref:MYND-type domain-containing protein n=1 Tax=Thalassiosira oceanica TaxID=159749 RepID=K0R7K2_THAOC|nr:hypothetical protein THAOC_31694 [Thalassiosira oceanica]|eukprot:EJK49433.1 hypothetical protein THAOC_31694 [Thalassiosira oceanica]
MPSRKKACGRQNRAKKEAIRTANLRSLWEPTLLASGVENSKLDVLPTCEHHLTLFPQIPQEGPAVSFMNHIAGRDFFNKAALSPNPHESVINTCFGSVELHFPGVQKEDNERALAIDLLLRFIRNVFVHEPRVEGEIWFHQCHRNEVVICCMINTLELLGTYSDPNVAKRRAVKTVNKLIGGNRRDVVKFVAKRLPCTCLKDLHRTAREKVKKVGLCAGCLKRYPRSELFVCTGCNYIEYCSRECQRNNWSHHKIGCGHPELMSRDLPEDYFSSSQGCITVTTFLR